MQPPKKLGPFAFLSALALVTSVGLFTLYIRGADGVPSHEAGAFVFSLIFGSAAVAFGFKAFDKME
jgi:hypothetical protein